jgi:hypothetical protein
LGKKKVRELTLVILVSLSVVFSRGLPVNATIGAYVAIIPVSLLVSLRNKKSEGKISRNSYNIIPSGASTQRKKEKTHEG